MSRPVGERFVWAVSILDPDPGDRFLEIGCGQGVAVSLICPRLVNGSITGIDRSRAMIERAVARNRKCIDAGTARFEAAALKDLRVESGMFGKVFAINVRLLRADAEVEAAVLARALSTRGRLYLFQQHPSRERTRAVTAELVAGLERRSFSVAATQTVGAGAGAMTCVVAAAPA